jgi:hypothetical protein
MGFHGRAGGGCVAGLDGGQDGGVLVLTTRRRLSLRSMDKLRVRFMPRAIWACSESRTDM